MSQARSIRSDGCTVAVRSDTKEALDEKKVKGDTYDDVISRLLEQNNKEVTNE